ncbi:unnamed protein product [Didymodactylos carnosus]|nr:unnamed protein product [Didymodactylos carnosus]CAF4025027.1 unnamed protein product [Didymodactylos carnosus]
MTIIKALANDNIDLIEYDYIPRHLSSIKKATDGILWNIEDKTLPILPTSTIISNRSRPLVMISYSHGNTTFCKELVEKLQTSGQVDVWVDFLHHHDNASNHTKISHSDDVWEEIAHAIESASIVILIISKEYYDSKSCRQELCYVTDTMKKRIIPVYPNTAPLDYKATGWLGIRIAGQTYIHFGRKSIETATNELVQMIISDAARKPPKQILKSKQYPSLLTTTVNSEKQMKLLKQWTSDDISKWFDFNHIHNDLKVLYEFHSGTSLLLYAEHLKFYYKQEYELIFNRYQEKYGKKLPTFEFIAFLDALYRLLDGNDNFVNSTELPIQTQTKDSETIWL